MNHHDKKDTRAWTSVGIMIGLLMTSLTIVSAATSSSPSATPTTNKIEDLKERLATKVAQLRQLQSRAMFGSVQSTSISSITIETPNKEVKIELTDTIAVFQTIKGKRTKLTTDDVTKGDLVTVFGDWDATVDTISAKVIVIQAAAPERVFGVISAIDTKEYTATIQTESSVSYTIDIEKFTKTIQWNGNNAWEKSGFSQVKIGDTIAVIGTLTPKKENRMSALRIVNLGSLTGVVISPTATPQATPKTASPSASPKPSLKTTAKPTPEPTP